MYEYKFDEEKHIKIHLFIHFISQYELKYNLRGGSQALQLLVSPTILIQVNELALWDPRFYFDHIPSYQVGD